MASSEPNDSHRGVGTIGEEQFHCLYVNLNSIAELALKLIASELAGAEPPGKGPPDEQEEPDLDALLDPSAYDLSELDRLDALAEESARAQLERQPPAPREQAPERTPPAAPRDDGSSPAHGIDYDLYMRGANADDAGLRERLARYYQKADLRALGRLLEGVPGDLPPLTERMTGTEIGVWVRLYRTRHEGLGDLVVEIRTLED